MNLGILCINAIVLGSGIFRLTDAGYCDEVYTRSSTCYRSERYETNCGFLGLDKCTAYSQARYTCYVPATRRVCCTGYKGSNCNTPICSAACKNGGTCVAPNQCSCRTGFELPQCEDINECDVSNGGCSDTCANTDGSYNCGCPAGYVLDSDGLQCTDVNECLGANNGGCQNNCTNTPGSFVCSCSGTSQLNTDGKTCTVEAETEDETFLGLKLPMLIGLSAGGVVIIGLVITLVIVLSRRRAQKPRANNNLEKNGDMYMNTYTNTGDAVGEMREIKKY